MKSCFFYLLVAFFLVAQSAQAQNIADYQFEASSGSFTPLSNATNANISAKKLIANDLPIGFTFYYAGESYTKFGISTNGFIALESTGFKLWQFGSNNLSNGISRCRPILAPLFDDLSMNEGTVSYQTTGDAGSKVLTVEWLNAKWASLGSIGISFQVKLYEADGKIEFIYRQEAGSVLAGSASIGITGASTGSGNFLSLNNTSASPSVSSTTETTDIATKPANGQVYTFKKPTPAPEIEIFESGNLNPINSGGTVDLTKTIKALLTFTIKNKGESTLNLSNPAVDNSNELALEGSFPSSVAPGSSATFQILYTSTTTGNHTRQLTFTTNDGDEGNFTLNFSTGTSPSDAILYMTTPQDGSILSGHTIYFTTPPTQAKVIQTLAIYNRGGGTLNLSNANISGAGFSLLDAIPASITGVASSNIRIQYDAATAGGNTQGSITFNTDDADNAAVTLDLKSYNLPSFTAYSGTFTELSDATNTNINFYGTPFGNDFPIGFGFKYQGKTFTKFGASAKGFIVLGETSTTLNSPDHSGQEGLLAPLYDDGALVSSAISYKTEGSAGNKVLTVEWLNTKWTDAASNPCISFQVKLYEVDGRVEFIYRRETGLQESPSAFIGLSVGDTYFGLSNASASPAFQEHKIPLLRKPANGQVYAFGSSVEIDVKQNNQSIANGGSQAFGNVAINADKTLDFVIENTGTETLPIKVAISGDFSLVGTPATEVAAGSNTTISVKMTTSSTGVKTGAITIESKDLDEANYQINLSGSVALQSQTISFDLGNNAQKILGDAAFALNATASSGLAVTYKSADPNVATISGNLVTLVGTGTTTITASQAGNNTYLAAADVSQVLTVNNNVTGLPSNLANGKIILSPNPLVTNHLTIRLEGKNNAPVKITVSNNAGVELLIAQKQLIGDSVVIPMTFLPSGLYLIKIQIGNETIIRKIIKQ